MITTILSLLIVLVFLLLLLRKTVPYFPSHHGGLWSFGWRVGAAEGIKQFVGGHANFYKNFYSKFLVRSHRLIGMGRYVFWRVSQTSFSETRFLDLAYSNSDLGLGNFFLFKSTSEG
jgi:hypothetical protein